MVSRRTGRITERKHLSPVLAILRVMPQSGRRFPSYTAGQYIALGRDDVPLTRRVGVDPGGHPIFGPDVDSTGHQRQGTVMHAYSIASAPWETATYGFLEFYVVQEFTAGVPGRLSSLLLQSGERQPERVNYLDRIVGHFTLDKLVRDAQSVLMVGTGTGLTPFVSMVKQLHHEAADHQRLYTLLHTNRTFQELAYHDTLLEIETAGTFDFRYLATVSRPTDRDRHDPHVGVGRATNVLRLLYDLPLTEEEAVSSTAEGSPERAAAVHALRSTCRPALPSAAALPTIRNRLDPSRTVILTCGNVHSTSDILQTATRMGMRAEVEAW